MIRNIKDKLFVLDTKQTTYAFRVLPTGQLEHLYYGARIKIEDESGLVERHAFPPGTTCLYDGEEKRYTLEDMRLEFSWPGKGDLREPAAVLYHADGGRTSDFVFTKAELIRGTVEIPGLPSAYEEIPAAEKTVGSSGEETDPAASQTAGKTEDGTGPAETETTDSDSKNGRKDAPGRHGIHAQTLRITMTDHSYDIDMMLNYTVFPDCDVITRSVSLTNHSKETVNVERLMSLCMDLDAGSYQMTTFHGAWAREMARSATPLLAGKHVSGTISRVSSNRANPFFMIHAPHTTEDTGMVYGFNLIYSGNHMEVAEVSPFGKVRILTGIHSEDFAWQLRPGESFYAPEAVMTFSKEGFNGMSRKMHRFVREHIIRGEWKKKPRPVLLNSWEASYFKIDEKKLMRLAKAGKEAGIELFVMDDGWFGERDDDTKALGDWVVNRKKLPHGLSGLAEEINALGMDFGLWVEPEMISTNSELYNRHPDWAMDIPGHMHSEGRNQRFLDLTRTEVQDYIIDAMTKVFESANISYVKWDMNRSMSDVYSKALPPIQQGETAHRYVLGLYHVMQTLTERFPHILFEGCASGGNRFDLGILSYFPQIWASDDSDAIARSEIQTGYSYGYPMSAVTAHVSDVPNHQTLRRTPLATRFNVAAFGVLGYECNLCDLKKEEREEIAAQIAFYKEWRNTFFFGDFYRGRSIGRGDSGMDACAGGYSVLAPTEGNIMEWTVVSPDGKKAVGLLLQLLVRPNTQTEVFRAKGLLPDMKYHFRNQQKKYNIKEFGGVINTQTPIHVKPDSMLHNMIAKRVKMEGETEDMIMYGDALMEAGVHVAQAFSATGYSDEVRHMPDFASRLYTITDYKCEGTTYARSAEGS